MVSIPILNNEHWHQLRAKHCGGTETAALFGLHRNITAFELYHRKKGHLKEPDFSDNDRVFWGRTLEPAIAQGIGEQAGWTVRKIHRYLENDNCPGMGATLDFEIVNHPDGPGVLEIKTVDWLEFKKWEDGTPPIYYELQLQQELACIKRGWGALGVLVGGNDLKIFPYKARPATIAKMEEAVTKFWAMVDADTPPPVDYLADAHVIGELYGESGGGWTNLTGNNRAAFLCAEYDTAKALESEAKDRKEAAKAELLTIIANADAAICDDWKITAKTVKEAEVSYVRQPYRNFRLTKIKEKTDGK